MSRISLLRTTLRTSLLCSLLAVGLLVVGCDSGGSNGGGSDGDNLSGSVTAKLTETSSSSSSAKANVDGTFTAVFTFPTDSGNCATGISPLVNGSTPIEKKLEPKDTSVCEGDDFDKVLVSFVPDFGSASGLTLSVFSNGNEVASSSSVDSTGSLSVTATDPGFSDGGGDGG